MLRQYLSMPLEPVLGLPAVKKIRCACSDPFGQKDKFCHGNHLFNCQKDKAFLQRHEAVKAVIQECYKSAGITVEIERPVSTIRRAPGQGNSSTEKRYDIWGPAPDYIGKNYCIDVTIKSHVTKEHFDKATTTVLHAAHEAITEKQAKYRKHVNHDREVFIPLCAQTNGALHKHFGVLFAQLGERVNGLPPLHANWASPTFSAYWLQRLSCTLWRETARALQRISTASISAAALVLPSTRPAVYNDTDSDRSPLSDA